jgi:long-chain acyl-CoA synthetase
MARQSIVEFLKDFGARNEAIAVVYRCGYRMERWSYARILAEACRFARELEERGIGRGDAVLLWGEASAPWIVAFFGCVLRGAVVVPIDEISTAEFASKVAREMNARLVVKSRKMTQVELGIASLTLETLSENLAHHSASPYSSPNLTREDTLEVIFTSGTTAEPQGVVISHGNVLANVEPIEGEIRNYLRYEQFVHPLRFLNLLPMSHIFGQLLGLFIPPLLGGTTVFTDSMKPSELIETIRRERVSVLVAVPRLIESLQREIEHGLEVRNQLEKFRRAFILSENEHFLRRWWRFRWIRRRFGWKFWAIISGGAALPAAVETFWNRIGYAVVQGYGMTETTSLISLNHPFRLGKGSIGKPFPGMEIRMDENGEILVRGENIAKYYHRGKELQAMVGQDGWFHTGDLASVGQDGRLYFKGRRKNVLVTSAGMNVYPEDLEAALRAHNGVRDCVVIGIERDGNEEPCAVLLLVGQGEDGAAIVERANKTLAEYQQIRQWFEWPEPDFPRTPTQKPLMKRIREVAQAKAGLQPAPPERSTLAAMVERITGSAIASSSPTVLETPLNLNSLDRVELLSNIEDRYQVDLSEVKFSQASTMGELEKLLREAQITSTEQVFPRWPQHWLITSIRLAVYHLLLLPATYLLAAPRVKGRDNLQGLRGPVIVISNHVTHVDIGWILAALPLRFRCRLATAMRGERLMEMRRPAVGVNLITRFTERLSYFLVLMFFNVFPLPREAGFSKSFAFAGDLADRKWSILVFPEGYTSEDGHIAPFRSGIGLLATRTNLPVVPIRIDGLFALKKANRKIARPGDVCVTIGKPLRFSADQDPQEIARELHRRVTGL